MQVSVHALAPEAVNWVMLSLLERGGGFGARRRRRGESRGEMHGELPTTRPCITPRSRVPPPLEVTEGVKKQMGPLHAGITVRMVWYRFSYFRHLYILISNVRKHERGRLFCSLVHRQRLSNQRRPIKQGDL